jgi:hypothetical protein
MATGRPRRWGKDRSCHQHPAPLLWPALEWLVIPLQNKNQIACYQRLLLIAAGGGLLSLLLVAAWLTPDPRGLGTHQRLGLPPCSFRQVTGWRCPSCGMTTSWSHLVRGELSSSLRSNAGGTLLGLACLVLAPWSLISGLRGRWWGRPPGPTLALAMTLVLVAVTLADWVLRFLLVPP